ncbi:MAG: N-acetyltransferase [Candidatus Bipolaricaulota bacterium]|nr:N-acetyltransferase [Candidatus Bipolaricaulota bacterium]
MPIIRVERPEDVVGIHRVNELAFGRPEEAEVVDRLRQAGIPFLSLVAEDGGAIVGHVLFTPAIVDDGERHAGQRIAGMGLAPLAVAPDRQRQGVGSLLVRRGLELLRADGHPFVIVLGHPEYYPRFGFEPASLHGLTCQWKDVPDEAFMVLVLDPAAMRGVSGVARYRDEFAAAV